MTVASSVSACIRWISVILLDGTSASQRSRPMSVMALLARRSRILVNSSTRKVLSFIICVFLINRSYYFRMKMNQDAPRIFHSG